MQRSGFRRRFEPLEARIVPASWSVEVDAAEVRLFDSDHQEVADYPRTGSIDIPFTDGDDVVQVTLAPGEPVALNLAAGGGANNSLFVTDTDGNDKIVDTDTLASLTSDNLTIQFAGFQTRNFQATTGYDQMWFYGGAGYDKFVHTKAYDSLTAAGRATTAQGFELVQARLASNDRATLYDSAGTDIFLQGSSSYSRMMDLYHTYDVGVKGEGLLTVNGPNEGPNLLSRYAGKLAYRFGSTGFTDIPTFVSSHSASNDLKRLALLLDPSLGQATDSFDLAVRLRNLVYQAYAKGKNSSAFLHYDPVTRFVESLVVNDEPVQCQGAQILYSDLLTAFGIKHQKVYLWAENKYNSHASVELWQNNKWIVEDPTFNVAVLGPDGTNLGFQELRTVDGWTFDHGNFPTQPQRTGPIETLTPSLRDHCYYIFYKPGNPFKTS